MSNDDNFIDLMARAKSGDPAAIRVFLSRFEWEVQMMVRARLPKKLRIRFDSTDFAQAVWQSFFSDLRDKSPNSRMSSISCVPQEDGVEQSAGAASPADQDREMRSAA